MCLDLKKGEGFRILTGTVTSPTLALQIQQFLEAYPKARWHQWDPCGRHFERAGSMATFGTYWNTIYRFDRAARIVSLDADFLTLRPCRGVFATHATTRRAVARRRRIRPSKLLDYMSRRAFPRSPGEWRSTVSICDPRMSEAFAAKYRQRR